MASHHMAFVTMRTLVISGMKQQFLIDYVIIYSHVFILDYISLEENWDFVTNQFATSCDYLTFTTIVGYIYNYFLHLKPLATTL